MHLNSNMITIYGFPNCATVKKSPQLACRAGDWLRFSRPQEARCTGRFIARLDRGAGFGKAAEPKGNSWRKLDAASQAGAIDAACASALMLAQPSVIKRPVVQW